MNNYLAIFKKILMPPKDYLINSPVATKEEYVELHNSCMCDEFKEIDILEKKLGFSIDKVFFENLALHTQVCKKKSKLNYQHGRILYSYLRNFIKVNYKKQNIKIINTFETGTARGFSAICMSKAIQDSEVNGNIITIDILPHNKKMYWNCIDDIEGKKTRQELLMPWSEQLDCITFFQGETYQLLNKIGISRIHFAFLDAQHKYDEVKAEFEFVSLRQKKGDIVIFDDVTELLFPGVVKAVKEIENSEKYKIEYIETSDHRGYAVAIRS